MQNLIAALNTNSRRASVASFSADASEAGNAENTILELLDNEYQVSYALTVWILFTLCDMV